jgi:Helix-turn-helix domain
VGEQERQPISKGDRALTFREARELYGVPEHRLRHYRRQREIDFFKLGRAVFVSEQSLIKFLERHREAALSPAQASVGGGR